jgi:hypothetical protein
MTDFPASSILANTRLTGGIPSTLSRLSNLEILYVFNPVSQDEIGGLFLLSEWLIFSSFFSRDLSYNALDGTIPENLGSLTNLSILYVSMGASARTGVFFFFKKKFLELNG